MQMAGSDTPFSRGLPGDQAEAADRGARRHPVHVTDDAAELDATNAGNESMSKPASVGVYAGCMPARS